MDSYLIVLGRLLFFASMCSTQMLDNEAFISSVVDYLNIRHVIFLKLSNDANAYLKFHKSFSDIAFYSSALTYADLAKAVGRGQASYVNSLVVIYENDSNFDRSDLIEFSNAVDIASVKWLLITGSYDENGYERLKIPYDCEFIIAEGSESGTFTLTEIFDTSTVFKLSTRLGMWSPENGLEASARGFFSRRMNLSNTTFNVTTSDRNPCSKHGFENEAGSLMKCIHYRMFTLFAEMHNFTPNWIVRNTSGGFDPGLLTPDIQFSLYEVGWFIGDGIGVTWPTMRIPLHVFASYIGQGIVWDTFINAFAKEMWFAISVWFLVSAAAISAAEFVILKLNVANQKNLYFNFWFTNIFLSLSAFCCQSSERDVGRTSWRILWFLIFLVPAALIPGYSAALTSFLAVKLEKMPFTNLEELSKAKDYKLGYHALFNLSYYFEEDSSDETVRTIMKDIVVPNDELPYTESEGLRKLCEEKYAYLTAEAMVKTIPPKCAFFKLDMPTITIFVILPIRLDLPYKHIIDRSLRTMMYSGVALTEVRRILPPSLSFDYMMEHYQLVRVEPIMFQNIGTAIIGLGLGICLSFLVLFGEIFYSKRKVSNLNRLNNNLGNFYQHRENRFLHCC